MLTVNNISKSFGPKMVLNSVNFTVNSGDRSVILGVNGSGKSTLLKIIAGEIKPDQGSVQFTPTDLNCFYIPQVRSFKAGQTIGECFFPQADHTSSRDQRLEKLSTELSRFPTDQALIDEFDALLNEMQQPVPDQSVTEQVLRTLGFSQFKPETVIDHLSGGQKTRLYLAKAVLSGANLLLLDEPTNDLDEEMLVWLEDWFTNFPSGILFVSHDRTFLNRTVTQVLELDRDTHLVRAYDGNYEDWLERKADEAKTQQAAWTRQQHSIRELQDAVRQLNRNAAFKKGGKGDSGDKFAKGFFANRTKGTMKRAIQLDEKLQRLKNEDRIDKPGSHWKIKMEFSEMEETGDQVLILDDLTVGYPGNPLVESIDLRLTRGKCCVLTGRNGSGKSTLLKTITGDVPPLAGRVVHGSNIKIGTLTQGVDSPLFKADAFQTLAALVSQNETEVRRILSYYLFFGDDVFIPTENLSSGQRARLTLACFALTGVNLLLLDEPLNHLDIESREQFEEVLQTYPGTVLAVVHDRYFAERCADTLWRIEGQKLVVLS